MLPSSWLFDGLAFALRFDNGVDVVTDLGEAVGTGETSGRVQAPSFSAGADGDELEIDLAMLAAAGGFAAASAEIARQVRERILRRLMRESESSRSR